MHQKCLSKFYPIILLISPADELPVSEKKWCLPGGIINNGHLPQPGQIVDAKRKVNINHMRVYIYILIYIGVPKNSPILDDLGVPPF